VFACITQPQNPEPTFTKLQLLNAPVWSAKEHCGLLVRKFYRPGGALPVSQPTALKDILV